MGQVMEVLGSKFGLVRVSWVTLMVVQSGRFGWWWCVGLCGLTDFHG